MKRLLHSLEGRVLALALGVVVLVWCAAAALTWADARHELDELLDGHLAQAAALLVAQQLADVDEQHAPDAPVLHRYAPKVAFQVFHEGRLALRSANAPLQPMAGPAAQAGAFHTVRIGGEPWRVFVTRGAERDVLVQVGEQADSRAAILRAVLRGAFWPMLLALPLLALALWAGVRGGLAPLRELGRLLAARGADDLRPVVLADAPSEMRPMLDALAELFARIAGLLAAERRFTADAAHELRTPIAAIRAQAQVALAEPDADRRRHALQATLEGCDRASRLVDQLLTLARVDAAGLAEAGVADLRAVARQVAADLAPAAIAKSQELSLQADAPAPVRGDATLLAVLVRNLVDNAIRHGAAGARIALRIGVPAGGVLLEVEDSGPGLDDDALRRLGDRFYRVPGTVQSGSGLGLSIVRRIAAVHGARLRFERGAAGGLRVVLEFARAQAE